jgi:hypothetical protein
MTNFSYMFRYTHHHQGAHYSSLLKLQLPNVTNITSASSNNALPDDGDCTETCSNCLNVNFNVNFKIVFKTIQLWVSWWIKKL